MADPRNTVDFAEIKPLDVSFLIDGVTVTFDRTQAGGSAQVGLAARLMPGTPKTIELVGDNERVLGEILRVEGGVAVVRIGGVATFKGGAAATLTPGTAIVGALGAASAEGYIKSAASPGAAYAETAADAQEAARGMILDSSTTTAVQVLMNA